MGGVPVLFVLVAMGITYGWQPDGNGGVEYVIQIPPEQLEDLKRSGELTSVINPKVQSHVSRVIVKVGNEVLSETTPPELNRSAEASLTSSVQTTSHDGSPIPIPEIRESVMKPADGFSLPPSLDDAASRAAGGLRAGANNVAAELERRARENAAAVAGQTRNAGNELLDRAGNALRNAADTAMGRGANSATSNSTYSNAYNTAQPPNFTGTDQNNATARARQGVPSTDPTNQRDRIWSTGGRAAVPSTEPVGPPDLRSTTPTTASIAPPTNVTGQQPNRSTEPPSNTGGYGSTSTFGSLPADLRQNSQDPRYASTANDPRMNTAISYGTSFGPQNRNETTTPQSRVDVDPRLTEAQVSTLPVGAWSIDAYGRPVDREGRVLDQWGRPVDTRVAATNTATDTRLNSPTGYDYTRANVPTVPVARVNSNQGNSNQVNPVPSYTNQYDARQTLNSPTQFPYSDPRTQYADPRAQYTDPRTSLATNGNSTYYPTAANQAAAPAYQPAASRIEPSTQNTLVVDRAAVASSDHPSSYAAGSSAGSQQARTESNGPLFNTLLLVSAVGNLYLFFWLKNLRYRFRDLVAAKRVVASNSTAI